jgi:hypothetical protein
MTGDARERDAQWCAVEDALAVGEAPPPVSPAADPRWAGAWAREHAFYAALARRATGDGTCAVPSADDLALIDTVLARHTSGDQAGEAGEADVAGDATVVALPRRRSPVRRVMLALAAAAAVVLGVSTLTPNMVLRGSEGAWIAEGGQFRHFPGDALPLAVWLVAEAHACATLDDASLCAGQGTVLRVSTEGGRARVEVRRGTVTVDGTLMVQTPAGALRGDEASRFAVAVAADDGAVEVDVQRGTLELGTPAGARTIEAGQRVRLGDDEPAPAPAPEPAPTLTPPSTSEPAPAAEPVRSGSRPAKPSAEPGELLVQARARLGEGDDTGAAKAYATLIKAHPGSVEAQAARVSLGKLRLAAGRHEAALALFDRYLERGGPLAVEAQWGKIQALAALGRDAQLEAAVNELVREHPNSFYRSRAQALVSKRRGR